MTGRTPEQILRDSRVVATVGISTSAAKEAHRVPAALATIGFRILPIHPTAEVILGEAVHRTLTELPDEPRVDVVQVFRPPDEIPAIAAQAVEIGA
ncbi:MAG: CoA-binding protein, partial [Actinomycetota bacterium]